MPNRAPPPSITSELLLRASPAEHHLGSLLGTDVCPLDGNEYPASEDFSFDALECPITYDAAYRMRATRRRVHRYCRDAGG